MASTSHDRPPQAVISEKFAIKDCALVALATGKKANGLREFRDILLAIEPGCLYHHFWGGLLQARFEEREYNNDFAAWVRHGLHDGVLAERLAMLHPANYADLEELRQGIIELIEIRLDEEEHLNWLRATQQFELIRSQIIVFDTHRQLEQPQQLAEKLPTLSTSSIFYHFIDARRRTEHGMDDFSVWLTSCGEAYAELTVRLSGIDPYFSSLSELKQQLVTVFQGYFEE